MKEIKVTDIKLQIIRGRPGPAEKRFEYSTLIEYFIGDDKSLTMGIIPPTYFYIKKVLNEELDDLERVILHNIQRDNRIFFRELFVENNLMKISVTKTLSEIVDRIVIDDIQPIGKLSYNFAASIFLNNGQRIPKVIPSDAVVIALMAKKEIYITDELMDEKVKIDEEIEKRMKKEEKSKDDKEETEVPKGIYT